MSLETAFPSAAAVDVNEAAWCEYLRNLGVIFSILSEQDSLFTADNLRHSAEIFLETVGYDSSTQGGGYTFGQVRDMVCGLSHEYDGQPEEVLVPLEDLSRILGQCVYQGLATSAGAFEVGSFLNQPDAIMKSAATLYVHAVHTYSQASEMFGFMYDEAGERKASFIDPAEMPFRREGIHPKSPEGFKFVLGFLMDIGGTADRLSCVFEAYDPIRTKALSDVSGLDPEHSIGHEALGNKVIALRN